MMSAIYKPGETIIYEPSNAPGSYVMLFMSITLFTGIEF